MKEFEVIIIGGGPAGLSVGSELAKKGHRILLIEKNEIGQTDRSWIIPGSIIDKLDEETQQFAYNGVKRFLEYTPNLELKWDTAAPWSEDSKWKSYPYIQQEGILKHWADIIKNQGSEILENYSYIDYQRCKDKSINIRVLNTKDKLKTKEFKGKMIIDASGYSSQLAKQHRFNRDDYFWWSVYGFDIEFDDINKLNHPGDLGQMKVGDYMLWQAFDNVPMNKSATLSELRPIMEYEVLDEKTVFVFILYFAKDIVDKDYMENQFTYILETEKSIEAFSYGKKIKERSGYYPSCGLSQKIAADNIAFVGDAGCWTIPDGWGMSFILNNYKRYAESLSQLIHENKLDKENLCKIVRFNKKQEYEILLDKLVLHFLAYAEPKLIDKFTKVIVDHFGGERLEILFCLDLNPQQTIETLKIIFKEFSLNELKSVFSKTKDYKLLINVAKNFLETSLNDGVKTILNLNKDSTGFDFKKQLV